MKDKIAKYILIPGIPIITALALRSAFGGEWNDIWSVMTVAFLTGVPYLIGVLTIYFSKEEKIESLSYLITYPWIPVIGFFFLTLLFSLEGMACWIMILPIFMLFSSIGGVTCGYLRRKKSDKHNKLHVSLALILPLVIAPIEAELAASRSLTKAYTSIEISASASSIWNNVTSVTTITDAEQNQTFNHLIGIPKPLKAELNYQGIGAVREASFSGGLIFTEVVTAYDHEKFMEFTIEPNTGEIPSTTFDEHILIGGEYFDVLTGTYRLVATSATTYELQLWSEFELNTSFNWYASIWARLIMKDIQNNILKVIKERAENPFRTKN